MAHAVVALFQNQGKNQMASIAAKAKREFIARERMETAVAILSGAYGIERSSAPARPVRDKELKQVIQLEETAEFLEMLIHTLGVTPEVVETDPVKTEKTDAEKIDAYLVERDRESTIEEVISKPRSRRSR